VFRDQIPSRCDDLSVYVKKRDANNEFLKTKPWMCVLEKTSRDVSTNTFVPTTNEKSLKLLLTIAVIFRLMVVGIDVKGAF
jgi:hypothetical protein